MLRGKIWEKRRNKNGGVNVPPPCRALYCFKVRSKWLDTVSFFQFYMTILSVPLNASIFTISMKNLGTVCLEFIIFYVIRKIERFCKMLDSMMVLKLSFQYLISILFVTTLFFMIKYTLTQLIFFRILTLIHYSYEIEMALRCHIFPSIFAISHPYAVGAAAKCMRTQVLT